jgi:hypothetical protein
MLEGLGMIAGRMKKKTKPKVKRPELPEHPLNLQEARHQTANHGSSQV